MACLVGGALVAGEEKEEHAPTASIRVCYASLATESQVGMKLRRCTRCKVALYVSRDAQREHWKVHKSVCREPNRAAGEDRSFREVHQLVEASVQQGGDADLAVLLARLMHLWVNQKDDEGMERAEMSLHALARGAIFTQSDAFSRRLWACPGIPEYLLAGEDLLSPLERYKAEFFPFGIPTEEATEATPSGEQKARAQEAMKLDCDHHMQGWGARKPKYSFAFFFFSLLVGSALRSGRSMASLHDGKGTVRPGPVAAAAARRAMELWCHPGVRACCGDSLSPAPAMALACIHHSLGQNEASRAYRPEGGAKLFHESEDFAPGLAKDATVLAILDELQSSSAAMPYVVELLRFVSRSAKVGHPRLWDALGLRRRARLCLKVAEACGQNEDHTQNHHVAEGADVNDDLGALLDTLCFCSDWHALWSAAAEGRDLVSAGWGVEERSFFMALLRVVLAGARVQLNAGLLCSAGRAFFPDEVTQHICGFAADSCRRFLYDWAGNVADGWCDPHPRRDGSERGNLVGNLARVWNSVSLKPRSGATSAAQAHAKEKLTCYRLTGTLGVDYWDFMLPDYDEDKGNNATSAAAAATAATK